MMAPHAGTDPRGDAAVPAGTRATRQGVRPMRAATAARPARAVGVVGGRGFLGAGIASALRAGGHEVRVLGRRDPVVDADGLAPDVAGADWVVWAASSINPMIAQHDPDRVALDAEAFDGFLAGLAAAGDDAPRVLLLSSGGTVYDETASPPYAEDSPTVPRSAYGRAKLALERRLLDVVPEAVVLRVANAYGPGQQVAPGQGVVAHWLHAVAAGQPVHLFGDPAVARDYVHVDDIADAARLVVESDLRGEPVLNVGAGRATSLSELLDAVQAATDAPLRVERHEARTFDARSTWLDCTRAERALGWRPRVGLHEGIAGTWHAVLAGQPESGVPSPPATT
jgi:UDP-glucose 4-epimerase